MSSDGDTTASSRPARSDSSPPIEARPPTPVGDGAGLSRSKRRVRSGCITCKIRKVKCDEEKPVCKRCKSTGRKCDGYSAIAPITARKQSKSPPTSRQQSLSPTKVPSTMTLKARELRSLEFFQLRTIPAVGSYFESKFWDRLVLQVSQTEPTIRNGMLAVSTLHELSESIGLSGHELSLRCSPDHPSFALAVNLYTKALQLLQQRLTSGHDAIPVALIACTLFTCFESLRGNIEPALGHIQSGMNIIKSMKRLTKENPNTSKNSPIRRLVDEDLVPVFARMSIMSQTFGQPAWQLIPEEPPDSPIPAAPREESYHTIEEARVALVEIITLVLHFKHSCNVYRYPPYLTPPAYILSERSRLQNQLFNWQHSFDALLNQQPYISQAAVNIVRIHYAVASGWLAILLSPGERAYDAHNELFQHILALATECIVGPHRRDAKVDLPRYTFDMGLIGPLYWVAVRCRDPLLRRQALDLLARGPRREGLWDALEVQLVARRCIELEEAALWVSQPWFQQVPPAAAAGDGTGGITPGHGLQPGVLPLPLPLPEEAARIHDCGIEYARGHGRGGEIVATMIMKPDGLEGEWLIKQEKLYREKAW